MAERAAETYEEWLRRTETRPSPRISWLSWAGLFLALLLIVFDHAYVVGALVLARSLVEPVTVLSRAASENLKLQLSVAGTCAWALAGVVALLKTPDHDSAWWTLLAAVVVMIAVDTVRVVRFRRNQRR